MGLPNEIITGLIGSSGYSGYEIGNSAVFDGSTDYLTFTPSSTGNRKKWTTSFWVKRHALGETTYLYTCAAVSGNDGIAALYFNASDELVTYYDTSGANPVGPVNSRKYRDVGAWYHIIWAVDAVNTVHRIWVNGVEETANASYYPPNFDYGMNYASHAMAIGSQAWNLGGNYADVSVAELHHLDGQYITDPTNFGEFYQGGNKWRPIQSSGLTYGTNGLYLPFTQDTPNLGTDYSGNGNDWTENGSPVQSGDSPTVNYATWNPLQTDAVTLSEGNLLTNAPGYWSSVAATQHVDKNSGKVFVQTLVGNRYGSYAGQGFVPSERPIAEASQAIYYGAGDSSYTPHDGLGANFNGAKFGFYDTTGTTSYAFYEPDDTTVYSTNDLYVFHALDFENERYWVGTAFTTDSAVTWWGPSGKGADPTTPSTGLDISAYLAKFPENQTWYFAHCPSVSSGNAWGRLDAGQNGYAFAGAKPEGFSDLSAANLPEVAITDPGAYFETILHTGTGVEQSVTGVGFQPDFTWIKNRDSTDSHMLFDVIRGATNVLHSNETAAEATEAQTLKSFDSDGFTLGTDVQVNTNTEDYVSWNWKAGGSGVTNTDGSVASTVSVNDDAGFSIVKWDLVSGAHTVGHGQSDTVELIIQKNRDRAVSWNVYHKDVGETKRLLLNETLAAQTATWPWNDTAPTTSVFSIGNRPPATGAVVGDKMLAYCFRSIPGYSKVGSLELNNSLDGTFVFLGFKPAFFLMKMTASGHWGLWDDIRNPFNVSGTMLRPNDSGPDLTGYDIDILSNGVKIRDNHAQMSSGTAIFYAVARHPFGGSNIPLGLAQ